MYFMPVSVIYEPKNDVGIWHLPFMYKVMDSSFWFDEFNLG